MDFNAWLADMTGFRIVYRRSAQYADSLGDCRRAEYSGWRRPVLPSHEQDRTASLDRKYMDRIRARYAGSGTDHARVLRPADDRH